MSSFLPSRPPEPGPARPPGPTARGRASRPRPAPIRPARAGAPGRARPDRGARPTRPRPPREGPAARAPGQGPARPSDRQAPATGLDLTKLCFGDFMGRFRFDFVLQQRRNEDKAKENEKQNENEKHRLGAALMPPWLVLGQFRSVDPSPQRGRRIAELGPREGERVVAAPVAWKGGGRARPAAVQSKPAIRMSD